MAKQYRKWLDNGYAQAMQANVENKQNHKVGSGKANTAGNYHAHNYEYKRIGNVYRQLPKLVQKLVYLRADAGFTHAGHDLKTAFKNSTVWYYQELARQVGGQQMKYWLDKTNYGNTDTSGGIDKFWLTGGLRISPKQQIDFLKQFHDNQLPFSQRSLDIVKNIMIAKDTLGYTVRAKSGWGSQDNKEIGWYVGYFEKNDKVYYFSNCIQTADLNNKDFAKARIDIVYQIFDELKILNK